MRNAGQEETQAGIKIAGRNSTERGFAPVSNKGIRGWRHACYSQGALQATHIYQSGHLPVTGEDTGVGRPAGEQMAKE